MKSDPSGAPWRPWARVSAHLRLQESAQIMIPGILGLLTQGRVPPWQTALPFLVAYGAHVLSVY